MSSFSFFVVFITPILSDHFKQFNKFFLAKIQHNRPFVKSFAIFFLN